MKKKQAQSIQDPNQLNAAFLLKFAKLNYQAKNINFQMLNAFSNFLQYISDSLLRQPQNYSQQIIKALIDIAITVQFNLHMMQDFLSFQIQPVLKFMDALFNFTDKVFLYQSKPNKDKAYEIVDIFWPLLNNQQEINKVQVKQFDKIAGTLQKITNIPYIYQIESQPLKIKSESVLNETVEISFLNEKIDFSILFRSALSVYNQLNKGFTDSFMTFFEHIMNQPTSNKENKSNFEKSLNILLNITNSIEDKYNFIQIFFNRMIKSVNFVRNFVYALNSSFSDKSITQISVHIQKYYSNDHLLSLSLIILQKIISFRYMSKQMSDALQIISRLSQNWSDLQYQVLKQNDFTKLNSQFISKAIKYLINQNKSIQNTSISSLSQILQGNGLLESEKSIFQADQMDEKKIFQFIRQIKMRSESQDGQEDMNQSKLPNTYSTKKQQKSPTQHQIKIIESFQKIIYNLIQNPYIKQKLQFSSILKLQQTIESSIKIINNQLGQYVTIPELMNLMKRCFPYLVSEEWLESLFKKYILKSNYLTEQKEESSGYQKVEEIMFNIIIKKIETADSFMKLKQQLDINSFIEQVFRTRNNDKNYIINFHFIVFYLYFKKLSTLPEKLQVLQIQSLTDIIITQLCVLQCLKGEFLNQANSRISEQIKQIGQMNNTEKQSLLKKKISTLEIFLLLILDYPSGSYKLTLKKFFNMLNNDKSFGNKLGSIFNINTFILINQKQTIANFLNSTKIKSILGDSETPKPITRKFQQYIKILNQISFNSQRKINLSNISTLTNNETKQQKNLNIFINIKMNHIALEINKQHKIPLLVENVNFMKRFNTINQLEILLFTFEEYLKEVTAMEQVQAQILSQENQKLQQSPLIVIFDYLLKISTQIVNYNEKQLYEQQSNQKLIHHINSLKIMHITIQQALQNIQKLIKICNPPFELNILIKLWKNIKQSLNYNVVDKYVEFINQGQIVKLIAEITESKEKLKIEFSQLALTVMKKLIEKDARIKARIQQLQKIKLEAVEYQDKIVEQNEQENLQQKQQSQIIQQQSRLKQKQMKDLSFELKKLYLLYFPLKNNIADINTVKIKLSMAILQLLSNQTFGSSKKTLHQKSYYQQTYKTIVQDLIKNISIVKQITIKQCTLSVNNNDSTQQNLWNFEYKNQIKFIKYIVNSILKMFASTSEELKSNNLVQQDDDKIFTLSSQILDNQELCKLTQGQVGEMLRNQLINMINERVQEGIKCARQNSQQQKSPKKYKRTSLNSNKQENANINKVKQIGQFLQSSQRLYNIVKKIVNPQDIPIDQIINSIIAKDQLNSLQVSEYLIREILNLSDFIKVKSQSLTQNIFSYIMKVNESYNTGKQKLQIPQFICQFFNISNDKKTNKQLKNLQKNQRSLTSTCSNNSYYKCLKCDDKRWICYGCMIQCHKNHPVIYSAENKMLRCQCRQLGDDKCKLAKKINGGDLREVRNSLTSANNIFSYEKRGYRGTGRHEFFMADDDRIDLPLNAFDDQQQYLTQINKFGDRYGGDRFGTRVRKPRQFQVLKQQRLFGQELQSRQNPFIQKVQRKNQEKTTNQENFEFTEENYQQTYKMELQNSSQKHIESEIVSQSYLLPVFLQMFNQIYSGSQHISIHKIQSQHQKFGFDSISQGKVMFSTWKATNPGSYNVRLRKQNHLNNKSPSVSKQVIAQNQKFIIIASGTMLSVHFKERFLLQVLEGKVSTVFPNVHQHSVTFDVHTIDFSPLDDSSFCIAGLHAIIMFTITAQGIITRTNSRISVNNDYINKVRTSNLGIFYSTGNEIRLLNWSFKPVLTIKSSSDCLLKQWCLYEKNQNCNVYCVTSPGYTEFIDITVADQGKKVFTNKIIDNRKIVDTGASILVKDVQKVGKVMLASFKDGSNLIGNLQADVAENVSLFAIRNNFNDILPKKYVIGQSQILKGGQNQVYVVCTVKETLNPENSIHQGSLVVFKIKKDRKCQLNLINPDNKCQYFTVVNCGDNNWAIISLHDDGSLQFSVLNKPLKQSIDAQCKKIRQMQPKNSQKTTQKSAQLKQSIKKIINSDILSKIQLQPLHYHRQFSEMLKTNTDVKIIKKKDDYQITILNSIKVVTGFTLPFFGNVYLPHRTIKNTMEIGFSNLQILYYFAQGSIKFRVQKIQDVKYGRDGVNQRFLQKLQRLQRFNQLAMDNQRKLQLLNTIKQAQSLTDQVTFYGQNLDTFKGRITNFNQIFNQQENNHSKDKKVQKMAIILKLFIEDSIKKENFLCESYEIIQFTKNLRKISLNVNKETYHIIKELMISALKMYQTIEGVKKHVFNDQLYPLKYATQEKADFYYQLLKSQTTDAQIQQIAQFFSQICDEDINLGMLYLTKYPSLMGKIQKKSKKIDKPTMNNNLLKLYIISYQILKYKNHTCDWILGAICSIFITQVKNKNLREKFYKQLKQFAQVRIQAWVKNVIEIDGEENVGDINLINKPSVVPQQNLASQNNMASFYNQFNMGEMDEQAMIRMAIEMSQMEFKQKQQENFDFASNNNNNSIQEEQQMLSEEQMMMENQIGLQESINEENKKKSFLIDLIQHCTKDLSESVEIAASKIVVMYVVSKYINHTQNQHTFCFILERIQKILSQLSPNCDNYDKHILMTYFSLFSNILFSSTILKQNLSQQASQIYLRIKKQLLKRLQNVKPEKVTKLKCNPNMLGKIFRGQKIYTFANYAYGLISLILPPCEPSHILLALECYWLLPQSKQHYTKMKHMTTIIQGINTGNIDKIYEVSIQHPDIWRQSANIEWVQKWIQQKNTNWERALNLLSLYYDSEQNKHERIQVQ